MTTGYEPSEQVKRTQKILESIEQRKHERARLVGDMNSMKVKLEGIDDQLEQLRKQLNVELSKLDPSLAQVRVSA